jgi:hypothetical protein
MEQRAKLAGCWAGHVTGVAGQVLKLARFHND